MPCQVTVTLSRRKYANLGASALFGLVLQRATAQLTGANLSPRGEAVIRRAVGTPTSHRFKVTWTNAVSGANLPEAEPTKEEDNPQAEANRWRDASDRYNRKG